MNSNAWESIREGLMLGPAFAVCFALLAGLGKGGVHLQRHYLLRWLLRSEEGSPRELPQFLECCAAINLLQRSGGSYAFLHPLLRDHCASRPIEDGP